MDEDGMNHATVSFGRCCECAQSLVFCISYFYYVHIIHTYVLLGTKQEIDYQLMLMGIAHQKLPINANLEIQLDNHNRWIEERRELEANRVPRW